MQRVLRLCVAVEQMMPLGEQQPASEKNHRRGGGGDRAPDTPRADQVRDDRDGHERRSFHFGHCGTGQSDCGDQMHVAIIPPECECGDGDDFEQKQHRFCGAGGHTDGRAIGKNRREQDRVPAGALVPR